MKLNGKTIVVTGGGNGMGRELTLGLVERGARVAAIDIRQESLDETAALAAAGDRIATFVVDVTDREAVLALPARVMDALGAIDGVINNAGIIQPFEKVNDLAFDVIDRVIDINLVGPINMIKAFLPHLLERGEAHIANVSSMGGFLPVPGQTIYGASKAGVKLFTEGLYAELLDTNVGVSVILPGGVTTDITKNSGVEMPEMSMEDTEKMSSRGVSPKEAAKIMLDGIESDRFHIFVGNDSRMMNIATRVAPRRATHMIKKQMGDLLSK